MDYTLVYSKSIQSSLKKKLHCFEIFHFFSKPRLGLNGKITFLLIYFLRIFHLIFLLNWKESTEPVYCHSAYLTYVQSTSCELPGWMKHKL